MLHSAASFLVRKRRVLLAQVRVGGRIVHPLVPWLLIGRVSLGLPVLPRSSSRGIIGLFVFRVAGYFRVRFIAGRGSRVRREELLPGLLFLDLVVGV